LVPCVRRWLKSLGNRPRTFVEPFAGGAITGLTVAAEKLADTVVLGELDEGVAAVWETVLSEDCAWLQDRILRFQMTRRNVLRLLGSAPESRRELAFQTIVRNRANRGGILAPGATLVNQGENGRGVASRWYPTTLAARIAAIAAMKDRISFIRGDAFDWMPPYASSPDAAFFVDPPYTAAGKRAGRRLYVHSRVDHQGLFALMGRAACPVMLTYDESDEVRELAARYGLRVNAVPMKNTHHAIMYELVLTNAGAPDSFESSLPLLFTGADQQT